MSEDSKLNSEEIEQLKKQLEIEYEFAWNYWEENKKKECRTFADQYLEFLRDAQTERERTTYIEKLAKEKGFKKVEIGKVQEVTELKPGTKLYFINRKKNIALVIIGKKPITEKLHMIGAHLDTPRLDLKVRPIFEDSTSGIVLFKTHYYGGLKKYAWATIPLYLTGTVVKKDGTAINISIGKDPGDPVFTVPDVLIHYGRKLQDKRKPYDVIEAEEMNAVAGSLPIVASSKKQENKENKNKSEKIKNSFKLNVLKILYDKYGISEYDLQSAELSLVSGIPPRYVGLDKAMIGAAGQDDGVCSYTSARAILDIEDIPEYTNIVVLLDKEETGSSGPTGAQSSWLQYVIASLLLDQNLLTLHRTLSNIKMLSADVGSAVNPNFKSVQDLKNAAIAGKGILVEKYTGYGGKYSTNDATAEYMAYIRRIFDKRNVPYQIAKPGAVDKGGGGTIAKFFAQAFNCDVVDAGTPLINMHSPFELCHIVDIYSTYLAYQAFLTFAR